MYFKEKPYRQLYLCLSLTHTHTHIYIYIWIWGRQNCYQLPGQAAVSVVAYLSWCRTILFAGEWEQIQFLICYFVFGSLFDYRERGGGGGDFLPNSDETTNT